MTRTTGGAGNDEDAGNGDVCVYAYVRVCLRVCMCVQSYVRSTHVLRGWSAPPIPGLPGTRATTAWPHCPRLCVDTWIEGYSLVGGVEMLLHASGKVHDSVSVTEAWPETTPAARDNKPSSAQGTARTKGMAPCAWACAWACVPDAAVRSAAPRWPLC